MTTKRILRLGFTAALAAILIQLGCTATSTGPPGEEEFATDLSIEPYGEVIGVGHSVQLEAIPIDDTGRPVPGYSITWESDDIGVMLVSGDGSATAVSAGEVIVTAAATKAGKGKGKDSAPGQIKKQKRITVDTVQVASVEVVPTAATLDVGGWAQFGVAVRDADGNVLQGRFIDWASSDESIAMAYADGQVNGMAEGSAAITATSEGHSDSGTANVTAQPPPPAQVVDVVVWPPDADLQPGQLAQFYSATLLSDGSTSCVPTNPSMDPNVLFNGTVVAGCDSAMALLDLTLIGGSIASR